ncbi:hypothetical protein A3K69_00645 [Candidatus Bathyarchaeota archaeon RBG_16_57_9]|nr:MAG: hypothetical protein A3K69_00645 [Candidatus Bathyarchaeota archaeon RBG_16_57_9]
MSGNERVGAVIAALVALILFVGVPYMLPWYLPPDITQLLSESGLDLQGLMNQIMILGAVTAALTLVKGFVGRASPISLAISVAQNVASLAFMVVLLGAGDFASLGVTSFTVSVSSTTSHVIMDFRVFVYFTALTVALRVAEAYLAWSEAKAEALPPGRIPP